MYLYNLTLQKGTGITHAVHGNFSGGKQQEVILSRGKSLELVRPDSNTGKVHTVLSVEVFGCIRALMSFRLTGGTKDYIVVGSDSGRIVILEYNPTKNSLDKVHQETFGKSGCRRIVPGQYFAIDTKGRAVLIGAVEKQKLAYILNRDTKTIDYEEADNDPTDMPVEKINTSHLAWQSATIMASEPLVFVLRGG